MQNLKNVFKSKTVLKVLITSVFSTLACVGIIYAASTIGANISTTGDLTVDTNTFYVDATNNRVGIATTTFDATSVLSVDGNFYLHGWEHLYGKMYIYNSDDTSEAASLSLDGTFNPTSSSALVSLMGTTSRLMFISGESTWPTTWSLGIDTAVAVNPNQNFDIFQVADGTSAVNVSRLTIEKVNGYVGIGTTTPQYKLDVSGDINISNGYSYKIDGDTILSASSTLKNVFVGFTGTTTTTGYNNTFIGEYAGGNNTEGYDNLFIGYQAGYTATSSTGNVGIGNTVLRDNANGNYNTAVGYQAMINNSTGQGNSALGYSALLLNFSGLSNTAVGRSALSGNTTGDYNTGVGLSAIGWNATGSNNTALGYLAGYSDMNPGISFSNNIFIGYKAGYGIDDSGNNNIFLGYQAGDNNSTGDNNILIGYDVDNISSSTNYHLNIGDTIYGDLSTDKVGIGTSTPANQLEVHGTATSTVSIISETAGSGGRIILEDSDGAGCSEIYILDGTITSATVTCPSN